MDNPAPTFETNGKTYEYKLTITASNGSLRTHVYQSSLDRFANVLVNEDMTQRDLGAEICAGKIIK